MTLSRCRRAAREEGLAPALGVLCDEVLPGILPCGPRGHAVVPTEIAAAADRVWLDDRVSSRAGGTERTLHTAEPPGGPLILLRHNPAAGGEITGKRTAWEIGLVWLRLGLSEGLLDAAVAYLGGRTSGDGTLLHQQMVKGSIAEILIEQLEVHSVLTGDESANLTPDRLRHLQEQITTADRALLRLLGASSFLAGGPGEVAHLSELLIEAHGSVHAGA